MADKKKKKKETEQQEEVSERTVVTKIERIEPEHQKAYILFISGPLMGEKYLLGNMDIIIGRDKECDIAISDSKVSRQHLKISFEAGQVVIEDLGSTNGTFVNGERVIKSIVLKNGDQIHISSDTLFNFALGKEADLMFHDVMRQMANFDAVTGVNNKHVFKKRFSEEFSFASRNNLPLSLLMIDIDFFKKVNDTHGHMAGDYVLKGVAGRIAKALRDEDILARYGGEEFTVVLRGTDRDGAVLLAERIRKLVEADPFSFEKQCIPVTISIGVATLCEGNFASSDDMLAHADACMYKSKEGGRNRVTA
ncbi:MAG: GGDEF domain-containing protein [Pseudomonadota bacterium]